MDAAAIPAGLVPHLLATFDPASCASCSLFDYCRSELRASTDPQSLLVELGVPADARQHVIGLVEGKGASDAAPPSIVGPRYRNACAGVGRHWSAPRRPGRRTGDSQRRCREVRLRRARRPRDRHSGRGRAGAADWQFHVFDAPQASTTRLAIVRAIGEVVQEAMGAVASTGTPTNPDPVHIVVPDRATADVLASIADALAGVELSRLRWERDLEEGRPALTFDGEPAADPSRAHRHRANRSVVPPRGGPCTGADPTCPYR